MSEKILADRYRLIEQIGIGGMAIVYRAFDMRTGRDVAVKVLRPEFNQDAEFVGRFQREAEAASKMTHHNIVNLLDVGMDGENRYLIMEYVQGKTLKQVIQEKGRINPAIAVQITVRILSALQHAHQNGIIHRDIKPQNILVHADGHIKVADFGIARIANSSTLTRGDNVMGSVHYFSPEQASGHAADVTSDIYSVGIVLYEMLTGRVPFDGDTPVAIAMQHLHARPEPIEKLAIDVPPAIIHVCMMAMEKNPRHRYQTAREMAAELRMAMEGRTDQMLPRMTDAPAIPLVQGNGSVTRQPSGPQKIVDSGRMRKTSRQRRTAQQMRGRPSIVGLVITVLVTALVFFGLYLGGVAIYDRVINGATTGDYVGMQLEEAQRSAQREGLQVTVAEVHHASIAAGTVIMQTPEVDTSLRKGDTVVLTVSKGPSAQMTPYIMGRTVSDAIAILQASGLTLSITEKVISADVPAGSVVTQVPEAGAQCQSGDIVQVTVSGGSAYVPNLSEKTLTQAQDLLLSAGLTQGVNLQYLETDNTALHGMIAMQTPAAGEQVMAGASVTLTLYRVPSMTHAAIVNLNLPQDQATASVRVTLTEDGSERTVWQMDYPADSPRDPEIEISAQAAGEYVYKVYINDKFAYQQSITLD